MSEETLSLLMDYSNEANIPYNDFLKIIQLIEIYGKRNNLNERDMIEIATTSMTLWYNGLTAREIVSLALRKLKYSKVNIIRKFEDNDGEEYFNDDGEYFDDEDEYFDDEDEYFGGFHR